MFYGSPLNQKDDKQKKDKPLTRAEWNKKYQGKLDTKKGPKGPGHSGRFNELIGKKVTSGDKGDSPLDIRRSLEKKKNHNHRIYCLKREQVHFHFDLTNSTYRFLIFQ